MILFYLSLGRTYSEGPLFRSLCGPRRRSVDHYRHTCETVRNFASWREIFRPFWGKALKASVVWRSCDRYHARNKQREKL